MAFVIALTGLSGAAPLFMSHAVLAAAPVNGVVINEFSSFSSDDWVELYNTTDTAVSVDGWKLEDSSSNNAKIADLSGTLSAHAYLKVTVGDRLNKDGDIITLIHDKNNQSSIAYGNETGAVVDAPGDGQVAAQVPDNGHWQLTYTATPGTSNNPSVTLGSLTPKSGENYADYAGTTGFMATILTTNTELDFKDANSLLFTVTPDNSNLQSANYTEGTYGGGAKGGPGSATFSSAPSINQVMNDTGMQLGDTFTLTVKVSSNGTPYEFSNNHVQLGTAPRPADVTAPSIPTLVSPVNRGYEKTNDFYFDWTDSTDDSQNVTYEFQSSQNPHTTNGVLDTGVWDSIANGQDLAESQIHSTGAPDGNWYWQVRAIDAAGNTSAWTTPWKVTIDTATPTGSITSPAMNGYVSTLQTSNVLTVKGNASDNLGLNRVLVQLLTSKHGAIQNKTVYLSGTSDNWQTEFNTKDLNLADGQYALATSFVDSAGNVYRTDYVDFTLDNTKPTIEFATPSPADGAWENGNFDVTFHAQDNYKLNYVTVGLRDNTQPVKEQWKAGCNFNSLDQADVTDTCPIKLPADLPDGTYTIQVGGQDQAGLFTVGKTRTIHIDRTAPADISATYTGGLSDVTTPESVTGKVLGGNLTFQVTENEASPLNMYAEVNWLNPTTNKWEKHLGWGEATTANSAALSLPATAPSGTYQIKVSSISDKAGNTATTQIFSFTVDNTAPTITVKPGYIGDEAQKLFSNVSFKLHDNNAVDYYTVNGHKHELTNNAWSDANFQNFKSQLVEGDNTVTVYDVAGNSTSYTFTYDSTAPTGTFAYSNNNGNEVTNKDVTVTLTTSEPVNTPDGWTKVTGTDDTFTKVYSQNGKYSVDFKDPAGNTSTLNYEVKRIDKVAPVINGVVDGRLYNNAVSYTVTEQSISTLLVDGVAITPVHVSGWDYTGPAVTGDGAHTIKVTDKAGNTVSVSFNIDTTAPVVTITNPQDGNVLRGTVTVSGTVTDANPDHYYFVVKDATSKVVAGPGVVNEADVADWSWDTTKTADGTYTIDLEARDQAGNKGSSSVVTATVTVDNTAPVVTDTFDVTMTTGDKIALAPTTTDNSNVTYQWSVSDTKLLSDPHDTLDGSSLNIGPAPKGSYTATVNVTDQAGNATTATYNVTVSTPQTFKQASTGGRGAGLTFKPASAPKTLGVTTATSGAVSDVTAAPASSKPEVKGASTDKPSTDTVATTSSKSDEDTAKTANAFLGLGWWWLLILVVIAGLLWALLGRSANSTDNAA